MGTRRVIISIPYTVVGIGGGIYNIKKRSMIQALIIILVAFEIACFTTYGWFLNKKWIDIINTKKVTNVRLNTSTNSIFYIGDLPYVAKSFPSLFSKWYINETGRVYRFSKLSRLLDEIHFDLITNKP